MMNSADIPLLLHISLIAIGAMVSAIFLVAWTAFGRPRHALIWAMAFVAATLAWVVELARSLLHDPSAEVAVLMLQGIAVALVAFGFRRRSGRFVRNRWLVTAACVQGLATVVIFCVGAPSALRSAPLAILSTVMFRLAAGALTGRRLNERVAERIAAAVLNVMALGSLGALLLAFRSAFDPREGTTQVDAAWQLLLPALVTGIGLFSTFLMTADLADRTRRLAGLDMLTGLLNRRGFEEAAGAIIGSMRRSGRAMTLVLVDIDRFKAVNDRFGHPAGDRLICAFAERLRCQTQRRDLLARMGGEEFAIIMADADAETAMAAAETLRAAIVTDPFGLPEPLEVTASFGVTQLRGEGDSLTAALERADAALYRSKADGRNRATLTV